MRCMHLIMWVQVLFWDGARRELGDVCIICTVPSSAFQTQQLTHAISCWVTCLDIFLVMHICHVELFSLILKKNYYLKEIIELLVSS